MKMRVPAEGVKWELLGFPFFEGWEMGISCDGTGICDQENGIEI